MAESASKILIVTEIIAFAITVSMETDTYRANVSSLCVLLIIGNGIRTRPYKCL